MQNGRDTTCGVENTPYHKDFCNLFATVESVKCIMVFCHGICQFLTGVPGISKGLAKVKNICSPGLVSVMQVLAVFSEKPKPV